MTDREMLLELVSLLPKCGRGCGRAATQHLYDEYICDEHVINEEYVEPGKLRPYRDLSYAHIIRRLA